MKIHDKTSLFQNLKDESGQAIWWFVLIMGLFLGMGGLVVDVAHGFFCYRLLQASTNAAALAGAEGLPNSNWLTQANAYSSVSGNNNNFSNLPGVTMVSGFPVSPCLTALEAQGMICTSSSIGNAVQVAQTAAIPTYFLTVFGIKTINIKYEATASMRGASTTPYNVAIVLDATASMSTTDSDCGGISRFQCALNGVQTLLGELYPCGTQYTTCSVTSGVSTDPIDQVAIFTFPALESSAANDEYNCKASSLSKNNGTIMPYSFPAVPSSTNTAYTAPSGSNATYQVTSFLSDYRSADNAGSLGTTSNLSIAVGSGASGTSCEMVSPGGYGTYYASVIYQAQTALQNMAANNPLSQNVMIILSDGQSTATSGDMVTSTPGYSATSGVYPSLNDQCQQAIVAANLAANQGTRVYTVAYGSEDAGCAVAGSGATVTDTTLVTTGKNQSFTLSTLTPCVTMENMASSLQYFYSDYNQSGSKSTCQAASTSATSIKQIFEDIGTDFTLPRLIPNSTT